MPVFVCSVPPDGEGAAVAGWERTGTAERAPLSFGPVVTALPDSKGLCSIPPRIRDVAKSVFPGARRKPWRRLFQRPPPGRVGRALEELEPFLSYPKCGYFTSGFVPTRERTCVLFSMSYGRPAVPSPASVLLFIFRVPLLFYFQLTRRRSQVPLPARSKT